MEKKLFTEFQKSRSNFEQQIMDCWDVTKDIDTLYKAIGDRPEPLTNDEIMNTLLGLYHLYDLKFDELFIMFEASLNSAGELAQKDIQIKMYSDLNKKQAIEIKNQANDIDQLLFKNNFIEQLLNGKRKTEASDSVDGKDDSSC